MPALFFLLAFYDFSQPQSDLSLFYDRKNRIETFFFSGRAKKKICSQNERDSSSKLCTCSRPRTDFKFRFSRGGFLFLSLKYYMTP